VLIANQMVSPVVVGHLDEYGAYDMLGDVLGTCFSISGGFYMTAGHVVRELQARTGDATPLIATPSEHNWIPAIIQESEVLGADIGILTCHMVSQRLPKLIWDIENLNVLASVKSIGYAYGTHLVDNEPMIVARAFKGEVVCTLPRFRPIGFEGPTFSVHELSFQAPRGLSGAPLLGKEPSEVVKGVVIGNSQYEMLVSSETETESNGNQVHSVERVERLTLGLAVRAVQVVSLTSKLLKGSVSDHLKKEGLLR